MVYGDFPAKFLISQVMEFIDGLRIPDLLALVATDGTHRKTHAVIAITDSVLPSDHPVPARRQRAKRSQIQTVCSKLT